MPEGDKRKNQHACRDEPMGSAERNVDVAHDPEVERAVPGAPESEGRIVVCHAAHHVLGRVQPVHKRP